MTPETIKTGRIKRGLTQSQLGELIGLKQPGARSVISLIEAGRRGLTAGMTARIVLAFATYDTIAEAEEAADAEL